jgi:hypothetical protein
MHTMVITMLCCELIRFFRPTIQRIISKVMQDACVLCTFYRNYHSKFESYRTKIMKATSDQNASSL